MSISTYRVTVEVWASSPEEAEATVHHLELLPIIKVSKRRKPRSQWHIQYKGKYEPDHWAHDWNGIWDSKASCLRSLKRIRGDHYAHDPRDYTIIEGEPHGEEK